MSKKDKTIRGAEKEQKNKQDIKEDEKMTKNVLEKQNKELRVRLDNAIIKQEIERMENHEKLKELRKQMKEKDEVIQMLQREIRTIEEDMEARISEAVAKAVKEAITPIQEELRKANKEIQRQRAIINKDSTNSSKPSSKNGFKEVPNSRETSNKPQGGQKGHPGHRLKLPSNMDELEAQGVLERRVEYHTEEGIADKRWSYISRYTIDVETKIVITEHRYKHYKDIPAKHYNEVSYGENIKAQIVLLSNEGIIANKRLSDIVNLTPCLIAYQSIRTTICFSYAITKYPSLII